MTRTLCLCYTSSEATYNVNKYVGQISGMSRLGEGLRPCIELLSPFPFVPPQSTTQVTRNKNFALTYVSDPIPPSHPSPPNNKVPDYGPGKTYVLYNFHSLELWVYYRYIIVLNIRRSSGVKENAIQAIRLGQLEKHLQEAVNVTHMHKIEINSMRWTAHSIIFFFSILRYSINVICSSMSPTLN